MKRFAQLTAALLAVVPLSGVANNEIRFCFEPQDYRPFTIDSEDRVSFGNNGMLTDMIILAAREAGLRPQFITRPWRRCIQYLTNGEVDAIYAVIWKKEREQWAKFPMDGNIPNSNKRIWSVKYPIYTQSDRVIGWDGSKFTDKNLSISAPLGYVAHEKLKSLDTLAPSSYAPEAGFKAVSRLRLDGYVVEESIGDWLVSKLGLTGLISKDPKPFFIADWYVPLSHQWYGLNPKKAEAFWQALEEVRKVSGEKLYEQYRRVKTTTE